MLAVGTNAVVGNAFDGTKWGTPSTISGATGLAASIAYNGPKAQAVGLVRSGTGEALLATIWNSGTWSSLNQINADTTQGRPAITAAAGTASAVFWGDDYKYYYESFNGSTWSAAPKPVIPGAGGSTTSQPCAPTAPALASVVTGPSVLFVNGSCGGAVNHLFGSDDLAGTWAPISDLASNPSYDVSTRPPALTEPSGVGPELVAVYVAEGTSQLWSASRTGGKWTTVQAITNALSDDPIALAPLAASGAWMAFRGTDGMLYTSLFTGGTWAAPAAAFTPNVAVSSVSAARGIGTATAELVYLDTAGAPFHTRLVGGKWIAPVAIPHGASPLSQAALSSGP